MSAIEYGTNYWCVILSSPNDPNSANGANAANGNAAGDTIHLHADSVEIDATGTLTFRSAGRRPAGVDPQQDEKSKKKPGGDGGGEAKSGDGEKGEKKDKGDEGGMIYFAFAPGTWKMMYAAKLQDGAPASVEHWNAANGNFAPIPAAAGAAGFRSGK